jgi:hypothetical protein
MQPELTRFGISDHDKQTQKDGDSQRTVSVFGEAYQVRSERELGCRAQEKSENAYSIASSSPSPHKSCIGRQIRSGIPETALLRGSVSESS